MNMLTTRIGLILFFTFVFLVVYLVVYSVLKAVIANYYRYAQKAELQWTGPGRRPGSRVASLASFLFFSLVTAYLVVEFLIGVRL